MEDHGLGHLRRTFRMAFLVILPASAIMAIIAALVSGHDLFPIILIGAFFTAAGCGGLVAMGDHAVARQTASGALMGTVALLVLATAGTAWQIDMHMAFFAALAVVAGWVCWRSILVGAGVVAAHHLLLNFLYPYAVFPGGADFTRVLLHSAILVAQAATLIWLTLRLASTFEAAVTATRSAVLAREAADTAAAKEREVFSAQDQRRTAIEAAIAGFETRVAEAFGELGHRVDTMETAARSLVTLSESTSQEVVSAETASNEASASVDGVAAAAEELSASIAEIASRVEKTEKIVGSANCDAEAASREVAGLANAAEKIGSVVALIQNIAGQTNLLALNATIEAARAGDLGRGFAVVASEVKELANQTSKATEDIAGQITEVQTATAIAVGAITKIADRMKEIDQLTGAVGASVEQQSIATREIAKNVDRAAGGVKRVVGLLDNVTEASVRSVAASTGVSSDSAALVEAAASIRSEIDHFLERVRAA